MLTKPPVPYDFCVGRPIVKPMDRFAALAESSSNHCVSFRRQLLQRGGAGGRGPRAGQESSQQAARAAPHSAQLPHQVSSIPVIITTVSSISVIMSVSSISVINTVSSISATALS